MDKMAIFIWGVKDPQQIPAERKVKYQDVTIGMSNEITFKKDGTFVRGDNSGGTMAHREWPPHHSPPYNRGKGKRGIFPSPISRTAE